MSEFRYTAVDGQSRNVSGRLIAEDAEDATRQLRSRGWRVVELQPMPGSPETPGGPTMAPDPDGFGRSSESESSNAEAFDIVEFVPTPTTGERLSLGACLHALSEEIPSRRTRRVLRAMSVRLEEGQPLDDVLNEMSGDIPPFVKGLIEAGQRTGQIGTVLEEYLILARRTRDVKHRAWLSLGYSLVLAGVTLAFLMAFAHWIVPQFLDIFEGFGTELPVMTHAVIEMSRIIDVYGIWILGGGIFAAGLLWFVTGVISGLAMRRRLIETLPLAGPMMRAAALSRFCYLLALLVEQRMPLPHAFRLVGVAVGNSNLKEGCERLALDLEQGHDLRESALGLANFPHQIAHMFRWHGRSDAFADVLRATGESYGARAELQSGVVGLICEPLFIVGAAVTIGSIVMAMFMPLIKLLNDLS